MNVVVVRGRLAADPVWFEDRNGVPIVAFDLRVERPEAGSEAVDGATATRRAVVPVSWPAPASWAGELAAGDEVVVRGEVRKRFVRADGTSRPRTDVTAGQVVRASRRAQIAKVLAAATDALAPG